MHHAFISVFTAHAKYTTLDFEGIIKNQASLQQLATIIPC